MLEGAVVTDDSSGSNSDEYDETSAPPVDAGITYSFDAAKSPSQGSQILNVALAKAVQKFEDRETVKLVKSEYELVDSEGEVSISVAKGEDDAWIGRSFEVLSRTDMLYQAIVPSPEKKRKGKAKGNAAPVMVANPDEDEYEFI